jgi:type IV pilus assembly protein PilQ
MIRRALGFSLAALALLNGPVLAQGQGQPQPLADRTVGSDRPKLISNPTLLTLGMENADVRALLELMGKKGGMNMIIDESVTGTVRINLRAVPLDEALELVLKMKGLAARRLGSTLLVATDEAFRKKGFSGTTTVLLRFDNAKVEDVEPILREALSTDPTSSAPTDGKAGASVPGPGGAGLKIIKDARTNSLLVTAGEDVLDRARAIKALLDVPTPQVEIEVRMLEISENASRKLGLSYGLAGSKFGTGFNAENPNDTFGQGNVVGNQAAAGIGFSYNALSNFTANFNLRLDALLKDGQASLLASPKVVAQDSKAATVRVVNQFPVLKTVATQNNVAQSVEYINVGQTLTITPRIDAAGYVTLEVEPEISVLGGTVPVNGNSTPIVNTRSLKTIARVRDQEPIVIGGLKRTDSTSAANKIPLLGEIPFLGALFKSTSGDTQTTEIVLIVTPRILTKVQSSTELGGGTSGGSEPPPPPKF